MTSKRRRSPQSFIELRLLISGSALVLLVWLLDGLPSFGAVVFWLSIVAAIAILAPRVPLSSGWPGPVGVVLLAVVFAVPVVMDPQAEAGFGLAKFTTLCAGAVAALCVLVPGALRRGAVPFLRTGLEIPIALFVGSVAIATFLSVDPSVSLWGDYNSYGGFLTILASVTVFYLVTTAFSLTRIDLPARVLVQGAGLVVLAYALLQTTQLLTGIELEFLTLAGRPASTLGNANHLGGFIAMTMPLGAALFVTAGAKAEKVLTGAMVLIAAGVLLSTRSLSGFAGTIVGLLLMGAFTLPAVGRRAVRLISSRPKAVIGLAAVAIVGTAVAGLAVGAAADSVPAAAAGGRPEFWKAALEMTTQRPALGWGADTFRLVYPTYQTAEYVEVFGPTRFVNGAHNIFVNQLATTGVVGLLALVAVCFYAFLRALAAVVRLGRLQETSEKSGARQAGIFVAAFTGSAAAYLVQALSNVQDVALFLLFWVALGLLASAAVDLGVYRGLNPLRILSPDVDDTQAAKPGDKAREAAGQRLPLAPERRVPTVRRGARLSAATMASYLVAPIVGLVLLGPLSAPLRADHSFREGRVITSLGDEVEDPEEAARYREAAFARFVDAYELFPQEARYAHQAGEQRLRFPVDLSTLDPAAEEVRSQAAPQIEGALVWLERAVDTRPRDTALLATYAEVLLLQHEIEGREESRDAAFRALEKAVGINPWDPRLSAFLAEALLEAGQRDQASEAVDRSLRYSPDDAQLQALARRLGVVVLRHHGAPSSAPT